MIINVTGRSTSVKPTFHEALEQKLGKFDRFFQDDTRADVTITNEGGRETVEVTIHADGIVIRAEDTSQDRLDSLDTVVDSLSRQIKKNRTKLQAKLRKPAFSKESMDDFYHDEIDESDSYKVVRSKQFALKPMDAEEAILQMNLLGHSFFMFRDAINENVCVVYKRKDGNYGLIEPDPKY